MSKVTKLVVSCIFSCVATTAAAFDWCEMTYKPYVGLDAQLRTMQYSKNNGGNIFPKQFPQINGYVGLELTDYLGVELGYESTFRKKRSVRLGGGQFATGGQPVGVGQFEDTVGNAQFQGVHGSLVGKFPIWDCPNLQFIATVGATYLRAKLSSDVIQDSLGVLSPADRAANRRTFSQSRLVARLGGGLQHMITDCIGVRALIAWEDTNQFKHIASKERPQFNDVFARLRGSFNYSLGVFMAF